MMTSVTFPLPTRMAAVFELVAIAIRRRTYRRWLKRRPRQNYCPSCERELIMEPSVLLDQGLYRAAVFMARLQLERCLVKLTDRLGLEDRHLSKRKYSGMIGILHHHRVITATERNRMSSMYARSSKVVHGGLVEQQRATAIVTGIEQILMQLDDSNGLRQPGFCSPAGADEPLATTVTGSTQPAAGTV